MRKQPPFLFSAPIPQSARYAPGTDTPGQGFGITCARRGDFHPYRAVDFPVG
ncbi:hypothetical protein [Nocardia aurea]|uniref:hypothetical protein n=1 Tax=Nocardia aurea TaxID=2144174 RepID=UPI00130044CF|nr:hypothetical protein [Nocardia aurea]